MVMYNYTKLRILYIIKNLHERGAETTANGITRELSDLDSRNVRRCLKHYFDSGYVSRKPNKKYRYAYTYSLTKTGLSIHNKLKKRYEDGKELKLRKRVDLIDINRYY